jgi:acyl transferase domain-containing protein/NAD(P)-dependent dehydrogenase (short-subunit alcohol dehydrogenase family)
MSTKTSPIAIVGISCLFPKAGDLQAYWANIKNGVNAITPVPAGSHWNAADYFDADPKSPDRTYAQSGGFLSPVNFNPMEFGIAPKDIEATDTSQLLSLVAAQRALADAGYAAGNQQGRKFDRERTSVILGVTGALELVIPLGARLGHPIWRRALKDAGVEGTVAEDVVQRISDSYVGWQENSFPGLLGNVAAGRIANRLDLGGTNCVVDAACASSLAAIHLAGLELAAGRSDMVITGGVDTFNDIFMFMCFSKTPALSPTGDAKPFDRDCDGTVLGEGLGVLVLKRLADAERDGDRIYAVLKGIGSSSDGRSSAIYAPRAGGQKLALQRAYADAEITPETIGLIEAHGTGTKVGDATELSALTEVFQSAQQTGAWCALGSVKSQIGHTKAAAGVAGVIKAAMALHQKVLPPTIKITRPLEDAAPGRSPFYLNTSKRPWLPAAGHPRRAGVSALGFGGTNFHCVLEEHGTAKPGVDWEGGVEILAFSSDRLADLIAQLSAHRTDSAWLDFRREAQQSRVQFRRNAEFRLLIIVTGESDRAGLKETALKMLEKNPGRASWTAPAGIAFGSGARHGKLGALFPGQGSQYAGMLRDLACQFPGMMEALAEADAVFAREPARKGSKRLSDFIYPQPVFSDEARLQQDEALKATDIAQPALGAVSMGAFSVLDYFGVGADAACGHSYGELLALCGAGRIAPAALHQLSNLRGRLMAGKHGEGNRGAMLAVQADEEAVLEFLREEDGELVVANRNSPKQYVLSGPVEQIKRAVGNLTKRAIRSRMLQVSAAFHSPLVADARAPFAEALEGVAFDKGRMPVYANATGSEYPKAAKQAREVLASQIVRPVNFMEQIQAMHADGVRTFIEVGPGHVLSDLVQSILPGGEVETIALDASKGNRSGTFDLALALARLASLGHEVNLEKWENAPPPVEANAGKPALTVPLSGANYRAPTMPRPPAEVRPVFVKDQISTKTEGIPAALRAAQEGILALQRLQEQTAQLHKQFLEGQESARRSIQSLLELRSGAAFPQALATPAPVASVAPVAATPEIVRQAPPVLTAPADRSRYELAVLEVVCDKTGYPVEMLTLGMGMDSDLGIDSIKRVEIMAALRARLPEAPEIKPEHLGSLQTLEQVVAFLASGQTVKPAQEETQQVRTNNDAGASHISETLLAVVSEKTGYPVEMLSLSMGMDSDLGIDSIKRVEIMAALRGKLPGSPEIKPEHLGSLQTLQQVVDFLTGRPAAPVTVPAPVAAPGARAILPEPSSPEVLHEVLRQIIRPVELSRDDRRETISLPAGAQVWLTDDGSELCARIEERLRALRLIVHRGDLRQGFSGNGAASLAALVILSPAGGSDDAFLRHAFRLIQRAGPALRKAGGAGAAILATVSRLDGAFGFGTLRGKGDPVSGGLAGLVKTARHEWPEVHCKALDLDPESIDAGEAAEQIVAEIFRAGPVEVGLSGRTRVALEVADSVIERNGVHPPLAEGDVVVVSGGARGVTGDAALALARAFRPKLVLLGRSELGESEPAWLQDLQTEAGIKKALLARKKGGSSPKVVEAEYRNVLARREIRAQLGRLEAAGAQASYHPVDVRDGAALARILTEVRRRHGAIRGLIHGAGVLADRRIEDKTEEQFDRVYGTKVTGLRNLLAALAQEELKVIALFSSYTGRVGRVGQVDYAAANEVLNKLAQVEARRRPDCRVVSVNWGPWNGGMATPGVRKLFEQEGIGLIEPEAGAEFLVRELRSADKGAVEVLALAPFGKVSSEPVHEPVVAIEDSVAFVREVSVEALPCLESHVFNGRAVLPAALMVEWLAQAALHGNPGMAFHGLDNFKVLKGIVLEARQSVTVSLRTAAATPRDNLHVVPVRMTSRAGSEQGQGREILHAQADVLLTTENLPAAPEPAVVDIRGGGFADAYALGVLFHGVALHGIERVEGIAERGVAAMLKAASAPIKWMTHPLRGTWIADPLALDSAFQMMILWSTAHRGAPSLPSALRSYRQFVSVFPKGGCRAVIAVALGISAIAVATIQFFDRQGNLLASAEGCEFVMDAALRDAFRLNRLELET